MSSIVQAIPLENASLTSMSTTISDMETNGDYNYNGKYEVKTSSYYSDNTLGFNAFNNDDKYWECDNIKNSNNIQGTRSYPSYTQKTYSGTTPSSYLGGGADNNNNKWFTRVGPNENKINIEGEWIQIKLPTAIYLSKYLLRTPTFEAINTFPVKFTLVGSNNGDQWDYIDQQLVNDLPSKNEPEKMFAVTSYNKYSYFRLIVSELYTGNHKLRLNMIKLYGTPILNDVEVNIETFINLNRSMECSVKKYNKKTEKGLEGADFYRPTYSNYNNPTIENKKIKNKMVNKENNLLGLERTAAEDVLLYTGIFTGVFITGLFIHNMIKR